MDEAEEEENILNMEALNKLNTIKNVKVNIKNSKNLIIKIDALHDFVL